MGPLGIPDDGTQKLITLLVTPVDCCLENANHIVLSKRSFCDKYAPKTLTLLCPVEALSSNPE
jgi:hypothetical protein